MSLVIVADFWIKAGSEELVRGELEKLVAPTRAEAGCAQYDLHADDENAEHFLFYEIWELRELWQEHMKSAHLAAFKTATEGHIDKLSIYEMTHIG